MGLKEFDAYYSQIYKDRWPSLKEALLYNESKVARQNLWVSSEDFFSRHPELKNEKPILRSCWPVVIKQIPRSSEGLLDFYVMDPASVLVARALPLQSAEMVLDLCAAPGGKSLILFEELTGAGKQAKELWANELSSGRREQLMQMAKQYIPFSARQSFWVKGMNGEKVGMKFPEKFDAILVDAPCSGERHLLQNKKELEEWTPKRGKNLSRRQFSLLSSAWLALKPGGYLLYSTCSINPVENEKLMEEFLKRKAQEIEIVKPHLEIPGEEASGPGVYYLPDKNGFGPMYLNLFRKV